MNTIPSSPGESRILAIVPTLGRRLDTLARTLDSIASQSGVAVDLVIVAPQVDDGLAAVAHAHGARVITNPGHISAAVNAGLASAGAGHRFVFWLGDDDLLRPGALSRASRRLEDDERAVVCFGGCDYVDIDGGLIFTRKPPRVSPFFLQFVPGLIKQESCLFRRDAFIRVGGLDETLRYTMDLDILLKLRRAGRFVQTSEVQAAFCWHAGSLTVANRRASLDEALGVQLRNARGLTRLLFPIWSRMTRLLVLAVAAKLNTAKARA